MRVPASRWARGGLVVAAWAVLAIPVWLVLIFNTSTTAVVASHEAAIKPTVAPYVVLDMGPYVPKFRTPAAGWFGVEVRVGPTEATSTGELMDRYSLLAAAPELEVERLKATVVTLMGTAALEAAVLAATPLAVWFLVGARRRRELWLVLRANWAVPTWITALVTAVALLILVSAAVQPLRNRDQIVPGQTWMPLSTAMAEINVPAEWQEWELSGGVITKETRRLITSLVSGFETSKEFYRQLVEQAPQLADQLRSPQEDEFVAVLVSDRHDNIGMDPVVRAVADVAGATMIIDAGDDTSTGAPWESFSLDSLDQNFHDFDQRLMVAGNHDYGDFVAPYLRRLGWTHIGNGQPVELGGVRFLGADDPRDSGLGNWRDEPAVSFDERREELTEQACQLHDAGQRVAVLVLHDANMGRGALQQGCVDLVIGGHTHVQTGPTVVPAEPGGYGYSYTNGTTGGAAYAVAVGSKIRREAGFSFLTFRDGRAVGIQPVAVATNGVYSVGEYHPLVYPITLRDLMGELPLGRSEAPHPTEVTPAESSAADESTQPRPHRGSHHR